MEDKVIEEKCSCGGELKTATDPQYRDEIIYCTQCLWNSIDG